MQINRGLGNLPLSLSLKRNLFPATQPSKKLSSQYVIYVSIKKLKFRSKYFVYHRPAQLIWYCQLINTSACPLHWLGRQLKPNLEHKRSKNVCPPARDTLMYVDTFTLTLVGVHKQRLLKEWDKIDESLGVTCNSEREVSPCLSKSNTVHITSQL